MAKNGSKMDDSDAESCGQYWQINRSDSNNPSWSIYNISPLIVPRFRYVTPPNSNLFLTLKNRSMTQFADSEQKRVKKLLQEQELGDMRPSQPLHEMRSLCGSEIHGIILKSICMSRLRSNMRLIISISNEPLYKLAILADKISDDSDKTQVHAVEAQNTATHEQSSIEQQLAEITKEIASQKSTFLKYFEATAHFKLFRLTN